MSGILMARNHHEEPPPSYDESLLCEVLKARRITAAPPATYYTDALEGRLTPTGSRHKDVGSSATLDPVTGNEDAVARVSAATEGNAAQFIWYELPKHLKNQWAQDDIRAVLDDYPRFVRRTVNAD